MKKAVAPFGVNSSCCIDCPSIALPRILVQHFMNLRIDTLDAGSLAHTAPVHTLCVHPFGMPPPL